MGIRTGLVPRGMVVVAAFQRDALEAGLGKVHRVGKRYRMRIEGGGFRFWLGSGSLSDVLPHAILQPWLHHAR